MIKKLDINMENIEKSLNKLKGKTKLVLAGLGIALTLTGCGAKISDYNFDSQQIVSYIESCDEVFDSEELYYEFAATIIPSANSYVNITQDDLESLPRDLKELRLSRCNFIDDLSRIPEICPNIEVVYIDSCPSITDFSFLNRLPNLKKVEIYESAFISQELVNQLDVRGIEHNITREMLDDVQEIDDIIAEIITDDMTDEEKIQAVTYYVIDNYKYKVTKVMESNKEPLSSTLENKGGVCASYAYLTNQLLLKAGINSYETINSVHAWNIIELDGKYYYLDSTNIKQIPILSKAILKYFNVGFYYMTDPKATSLSVMSDYDSSKILIPEQMIEDIKNGEDMKNIFEKYGNSVPARIIEAIAAFVAVGTGITLASTGVSAVKDSIEANKRRKREAARRERERRERERNRNRSTNRRPNGSYGSRY